MGWNYQRTITIDHTQVPTTQTTFPVLFSGTYSYLATVPNGGQIQNTLTVNGQVVPADLYFFQDTTTQYTLPFEIASYNPVTGYIEVWISLPVISSTIDTVFYMLYGNNSQISASFNGPL